MTNNLDKQLLTDYRAVLCIYGLCKNLYVAKLKFKS